MNEPIRQLDIPGPFPPFSGDLRIYCVPHVNVLIGPNNSGRTRLLTEIAQYFHLTPVRSTGAFLFILNPPSEIFKHYVPALRRSLGHRSKGPSPEPQGQPKSYPGNSIDDTDFIEDLVRLDYRSYREQNKVFRELIHAAIKTAGQITEGFPLRFSRMAEDARGLYPEIETPDGPLPLDVLSQGTQSLIQWIGNLFLNYARAYDFSSDFNQRPGLLIIDEIDAHLHPSWQRRILPALTRALPNLQIFCSTHSPLMLAGLKAGQVHLLRRGEDGKVTVTQNETDIIGWSTDQILGYFMDVKASTDLDTEKKFLRLQELTLKPDLTAGELTERQHLSREIEELVKAGPPA